MRLSQVTLQVGRLSRKINPVSSRERRADEIYEHPDRYLKVLLSLPYGIPEFIVCVYMFDYQHELSQFIYTQEIVRHEILEIL